MLTAEGGKKSTAVEGQTEVAGEAADVGAFATTDAKVGLGEVLWNGAKRIVVEVGERGGRECCEGVFFC